MQRISEEWWIGLDESYKTRVEDGSLVLWRPARTVWISIWNDRDGRTLRDRLAHWVAERDIRAADLFQESDGDLLRHGYLLAEPEETGGDRLGLYSYTVSTSSTVQMACYFDLQEDLGWATAVAKSLSFGSPDPSRKVEEPLGRDGHLVLASERVLVATGLRCSSRFGSRPRTSKIPAGVSSTATKTNPTPPTPPISHFARSPHSSLSIPPSAPSSTAPPARRSLVSTSVPRGNVLRRAKRNHPGTDRPREGTHRGRSWADRRSTCYGVCRPESSTRRRAKRPRR